MGSLPSRDLGNDVHPADEKVEQLVVKRVEGCPQL
jgi:hypothetical protein